jgi:hypothetical protein
MNTLALHAILINENDGRGGYRKICYIVAILIRKRLITVSTLSVLGRLPIGITSGTGSHEPRIGGAAPPHA